MPECQLSIILPVFEDSKNLARILNELMANRPDDTWELIVVDDGSSNPLTLPSMSPDNWQVIHCKTNQGAAVSRNRGARRARGEYLLMLSVFLKIPSDYIENIKSFIRSNKFDFAQHLIEKAPEIKLEHFQLFLADQKERLTSPNDRISVKQSLFTAAIIQKETFCKLKGFDESMQHYGGHEMDLAYRLEQAGFRKRIAIRGIFLQRVRFEDHTTIIKRLKEYGRLGLPNLLRKHPELKETILLKPLLWSYFSMFGITHLLEGTLRKKIQANRALSVFSYRLYLHLIVRNAWDGR